MGSITILLHNLEGHSFAGILNKEKSNLLVDMSKNNVRPKDILHVLKKRNMHNATTIRAIYNARRKYKVREQAGHSQMQLLMSKLIEHKYIERHKSDVDTNFVKALFLAHPSAIELLQAFPRVLIMDCTYQTNRYDMPLLEIAGVTSIDLTFSVCCVYLKLKWENNYIWASERLKSIMEENMLASVIVTDRELALMKVIQKIFPSATTFLCRWHISRNVLVNCKNLFEANEIWQTFISSWNLLVLSASEEEFAQRLKGMETDFSKYPIVLTYIRNVWLDKCKEKFVSAWTNSVMHFRNVTSNK